ncbi:unnamed protein product, partial [Linum tenue]
LSLNQEVEGTSLSGTIIGRRPRSSVLTTQELLLLLSNLPLGSTTWPPSLIMRITWIPNQEKRFSVSSAYEQLTIEKFHGFQ